MSTFIFGIIIFGLVAGIVISKFRKGLFSGCSDCKCSCPAKPEK